MAGERVDPRYDPIFQRGYAEDSGRSGMPPTTARAVTQAPRAQQTSGESRGDLPGEAASPLPPVTADTSPERPVVTTEIFGEHPKPSHRRGAPNPFIVLLWVIGVGLTALGIGFAYKFFLNQFSYPREQQDLILQQLAWAFSPPAVTVGLAIIAGLLFWHAASWRRARAQRNTPN